jgi:ATP-dependent helicase/nuclease subunit A
MIIEKVIELLDKKDIKFKYVMIDEFQDSNALQFEIAKKIRGDNLFIVGDEKQSIYSFQGGEIEIFKKAIKEELDNNVTSMTENRRSDKEIIKYVNNIFEKQFSSENSITDFPVIDNNFVAEHQALISKSEEDGEVEVLYFEYDKKVDEISAAEKEAKNIACLIKEVVEGNKYPKIKKDYIDKQKAAIGVIYNSKTEMYYLVEELKKLGIPVKVHGVNDFWDRQEIKDAVSFLKVKHLINRKYFDSFWVMGVLNSKAFNLDDKEIYEIIKNRDLDKINSMINCNEEVLHKFVRKIFIKHKLYDKYDIPDLAKANIEDLIQELIRLEIENNYDYEQVLKVIEDNFLNAEKSSNEYDSPLANSIELSSIHHTKGLAYPLVILTNAHKTLNPLSMEGIKDVKYSINNEEKYAIGFKIGEYTPLAYRVASYIDKLKFIEEKKRLLYVALTRAQHNIVISSNRKFAKESFSKWLNLDKLKSIELDCNEKNNKEIEYEIHIDDYDGEFNDELEISPYFNASNLGEAVHKAIELYWDKDNKEYFEKIIELYALQDKNKFYKMIENFKNSNVYKELQNSKDIKFELEFEDEKGFGRVDLVYENDGEYKIIDFKTGKEKDYSEQLERYKKVLESRGYKIKSANALYLGDKK